MTKKSPASLQGSLIARKGDAAPAGHFVERRAQQRQTQAELSFGRPPLSIPTPVGIVDGRLGYRDHPEADDTSKQPLVRATDTESEVGRSTGRRNGALASRRNDQRADSVVPRFPARPVPSVSARVKAEVVPGERSGREPDIGTSLQTDPARVSSAGAADKQVRAGLTRDVQTQTSDDGRASAVKELRRREERKEVRRWVVKRRRSGRSLRYGPRRFGKVAAVALVVIIGAAGAALYDRDLAPQSFADAVEPVQEGLAMAFGSAVPLFADAVGIGSDTLTGSGQTQATLGLISESENKSLLVGAVIQAEPPQGLPPAVERDVARTEPEKTLAAVQSSTVATAEYPSREDGALPSVDSGATPDGVTITTAALPGALTEWSSSADGLVDTEKAPVPGSVVASAVSVEPVALAAAVDFAPLASASVEAPLASGATLPTVQTLDKPSLSTTVLARPIAKPLVRTAAANGLLTSAPDEPAFAVQLASYRSSELAARAAAKLTEEHLEQLESGTAQVVPASNGLFRVMSGRMGRRGDAERLCGQLKTRGQDCLVVQR